jgi:hypothetical protein
LVFLFLFYYYFFYHCLFGGVFFVLYPWCFFMENKQKISYT